jgi:hypothetical protein
MNRKPAQGREAERTNNAKVPQMPGARLNNWAAKWSRIISQPASHNLDTGALQLHATEENAQINSAMTVVSGIAPQFKKITSAYLFSLYHRTFWSNNRHSFTKLLRRGYALS